jgi:hypothetical protein
MVKRGVRKNVFETQKSLQNNITPKGGLRQIPTPSENTADRVLGGSRTINDVKNVRSSTNWTGKSSMMDYFSASSENLPKRQRSNGMEEIARQRGDALTHREQIKNDYREKARIDSIKLCNDDNKRYSDKIKNSPHASAPQRSWYEHFPETSRPTTAPIVSIHRIKDRPFGQYKIN